jgi:hypothetical protein
VVRKAHREWLVSYLGSARRRFRDPSVLALRKELKRQCETAAAPGRRCRFVECTLQHAARQLPCETRPEAAVLEFTGAVFCLQPPGDTPTRRSVFDSLLAGCIPVFFTNLTAHMQYAPFGFLPPDPDLYSVTLAPSFLASNGSAANFFDELLRVPDSHVRQMQRTIVDDILPRIVYRDPSSADAGFDDALDTGLRYLFGMLDREDAARHAIR